MTLDPHEGDWCSYKKRLSPPREGTSIHRPGRELSSEPDHVDILISDFPASRTVRKSVI